MCSCGNDTLMPKKHQEAVLIPGTAHGVRPCNNRFRASVLFQRSADCGVADIEISGYLFQSAVVGCGFAGRSISFRFVMAASLGEYLFKFRR